MKEIITFADMWLVVETILPVSVRILMLALEDSHAVYYIIQHSDSTYSNHCDHIYDRETSQKTLRQCIKEHLYKRVTFQWKKERDRHILLQWIIALSCTFFTAQTLKRTYACTHPNAGTSTGVCAHTFRDCRKLCLQWATLNSQTLQICILSGLTT